MHPVTDFISQMLKISNFTRWKFTLQQTKARSLLQTGAFDVSSHVFLGIVFKRLLIRIYHNISQTYDSHYST